MTVADRRIFLHDLQPASNPGGDTTEKTDFCNALRQHGLKNTRIRLSILMILTQSDQPLDAEQIYSTLKAQGISANLSTVYRALEVLSQKELITSLHFSSSCKTLYTNCQTHQHYLVCLDCKKMIAVAGCPLAKYEEHLEQQTGYRISAHRLDLYGYCPDCRKKNLTRGVINNAVKP